MFAAHVSTDRIRAFARQLLRSNTVVRVVTELPAAGVAIDLAARRVCAPLPVDNPHRYGGHERHVGGSFAKLFGGGAKSGLVVVEISLHLEQNPRPLGLGVAEKIVLGYNSASSQCRRRQFACVQMEITALHRPSAHLIAWTRAAQRAAPSDGAVNRSLTWHVA